MENKIKKLEECLNGTRNWEKLAMELVLADYKYSFLGLEAGASFRDIFLEIYNKDVKSLMLAVANTDKENIFTESASKLIEEINKENKSDNNK